MTDISKNLLLKELAFYKSKKNELVKTHMNQFVLIKDNNLIGAFTNELEAYQTGVKKYGNSPFLIKKVANEEDRQEDVPALTIGIINVCL